MMVMVTGVIIETMVTLVMVVKIIIRIVTIVMMMTLQQLRRWWWRWWWWWWWGRGWGWATTEGDKFGHQATIYLIGVNGRSSDREEFRQFHENHHHHRNFLFNLLNQLHFSSMASYKGVLYFFIDINITSNFNGWHARQLLFLFSNISRSS